MFHLQDSPGRTAMINGKEYLFFSGYSYLGMNHVPEFIELVKEGIDKYGWLFPSSRISNTQLDLFNEFEEKLSEITGMEATVCFSSGFLAGRAVTDLFKNENYSCAPGTHPAICLEKNTHSDFDQWKQRLQKVNVLFFDSVNPLTGKINDVNFLNDISNKVTCVIDDSHGIGLLNDGNGIQASLPGKQGINYILSYSLSKAYNLVGGAVSCNAAIAEQLRSTPYYTASTSIPPAFAYAFLKGQHIYRQQREKLAQNILLFKRLTNERFLTGLQLPIIVLPSTFDAERFADQGIIISSFAYPDPSGKKINRIVLNALHTKEDIEKLANALK